MLVVVRVVISGGTGFVGKVLCDALVERGEQVIVLTRGPSRAGRGGIELAHWTPETPGAWMSVVDGADAVVNLAGASVADARWTEERKRVLRSSRIETTKRLVEAIHEAKQRPRVFVSASAVGRYGLRCGEKIVTEDDPAGDDFLAQLTQDWERAAEAASADGVRVALARLGLVLGPGGGVYGKLAPIFRAFVGGPVGRGDQFMPWVHLRDAVRALLALVDRSELSGAYNVTAPEPVTMEAFAAALGASLGRPSRLRVPAFALELVMGAEAAQAVLTGQRAVPRRLLDAGFEFAFPDLHAALAELATEPRVRKAS